MMMIMIEFVFVVKLSLMMLLVLPAIVASDKIAMPWLCLERCFNTTTAEINSDIASLKANRDVIDSVSFEQFNLGPNSTLLSNDTLSPVAQTLHSLGFNTFAMVSSYPYPADFINWLRSLFADPAPFIRECIDAAQHYNLTGFNIDFEPAVGVVEQDALDYADFLRVFSGAMHAKNIAVTVDIAGWSVLWNLTVLNSVPVDRFFYMGTYANNFTTFSSQLAKVTGAIGFDRLAIGLQNYRGVNISDTLNDTEVTERFDSILTFGDKITAIGMWAMPLSDVWFSELRRWKSAFTKPSTSASSSGGSGSTSASDGTGSNGGGSSTHGSATRGTGPSAEQRLMAPVVIASLALAGAGCVVCVLLMVYSALRRSAARTFQQR